MKHLTWVVSAAAALGGAAACGEDDDNSNTTGDDLPDALEATPDAPDPIDAGSPDAVVPGIIYVGVRNVDGTRDTDAHVIWFDADDALLLDEVTGEDGESTLEALPGVTAVVIPDIGGTNVYVYQDLATGHDVAHQPFVYPPTINVSFTFPAFDDAVAYDHYRISGTSQTLTTAITAPIWDVPTTNIVVTALDGGSTIMASLAESDVAISDGADIALGADWLPPIATDATVTNVPANIPVGTAYLTTWAPGIGDIGVTYLESDTATGPVLDLPDSRAVLAASLQFDEAPSQTVRRYENPGDDVSLDIEASAMASLDNEAYDATTQTITWDESNVGLAPNTLRANLYVSRGAALGGGGGGSLIWNVHGRQGGGRWTLPALPAAYAALELRSTDVAVVYGPSPSYLSLPGPLDRLNRNPFFPSYTSTQPPGLLWVYSSD